MSRLEDQNAFSSNCVPHQRQIRTLLTSHILNNSGDLVSSPPVTSHQEQEGGGGIASSMRRTLCRNMSYTCSTVDMSDERSGLSMHTSLF